MLYRCRRCSGSRQQGTFFIFLRHLLFKPRLVVRIFFRVATFVLAHLLLRWKAWPFLQLLFRKCYRLCKCDWLFARVVAQPVAPHCSGILAIETTGFAIEFQGAAKQLLPCLRTCVYGDCDASLRSVRREGSVCHTLLLAL